MQKQFDENILGTGKISSLIAKFAIPSILSMMVNALYNIVDQIFVSRGVGYLGNAATNIVLLITMVTLAVSLLLGDGAAAYFSLNLGAGDRGKAEKGAGNALLGIIAASLIIMAGGFLFLPSILGVLGCTEMIMPYALDYGYLILAGLPFIMISTTLNSLIRVDGSPRYAMASMIGGAVLNACLDPVFIFGFGWGMKGAALSTVIGQMLSFFLSLAYIKRFNCIKITGKTLRFHGETIKQVCGLGISSFVDQIAFSMVMVVNNNLIVHFGAATSYGSEIPLTAYGIGMKVQEILFTLILGVAIGMQPIAGYNYGAGNYKRVREAYGTAVLIGTGISAAALVWFLFFPDSIIHLLGLQGNLLYAEFSRKFFRTYFLLYLFFGFQTITGVYFQAIGKPGKAAVLSLSYQLGFKVVSAVVLSMAIGLDGVLWSGPAADLLGCMLAVFLLKKRNS